MKWFKHETNSGYNAKMKKLLMKYGVQGYGLYYYCIEIIAGNLTTDNITFELEHDASILAYDLKMDTLLVEEIMKYCIKLGLFEYNESTKRIVHMGLFKMLDNTMSQHNCIKEMKMSENFKLLKETSTNLYQNRIEENRREEKKERKKFTPPSHFEISSYCKEIDISIDIDYFIDYYTTNGWMAGKNKMKDWRAAVRNWARRQQDFDKDKKTDLNDYIDKICGG